MGLPEIALSIFDTEQYFSASHPPSYSPNLAPVDIYCFQSSHLSHKGQRHAVTGNSLRICYRLKRIHQKEDVKVFWVTLGMYQWSMWCWCFCCPVCEAVREQGRLGCGMWGLRGNHITWLRCKSSWSTMLSGNKEKKQGIGIKKSNSPSLCAPKKFIGSGSCYKWQKEKFSGQIHWGTRFFLFFYCRTFHNLWNSRKGILYAAFFKCICSWKHLFAWHLLGLMFYGTHITKKRNRVKKS